MSRLFTRVVVSLLLALFWGSGASAAYKADIGFTQLQAELGSSTPTGDEVVVSQVEAGSVSGGVTYYLPFIPGSTASEFQNKTIIPTLTPYGVSGHATTVGTYFFGNITSIAPGITSIYGYDAGNWLGSGFLDTYGGQPLISSARVANHSWIGYFSLSENGPIDPPPNVDALKRVDWVIHRDEYIQVVGMNNGSGSATIPLLGSSFNAIAVGLSTGNSQHGSYDLGITPYTGGRTRPDLVAPADATSYATPMVSAAAALLVEVGHKNPALSTDPLVQSTTNRNGNTIYNAERSEVVKAALMAGASRSAISGYAKNTDNGLNSVYGAGQLNIYHSYHLIAAGEQNSLQDAQGTKGTIGRYGFDYDPYFGGLSNSNRTASYYFKALNAGEITASLVWNLNVNDVTLDATLYNLGLYLYDVTTDPNGVLLLQSIGLLDNTENLWWTALAADHNYLLRVSALTAGDFLWDYGLAWDISTEVGQVPVPGAVYLLGSGLLVLVGFRRKFSS
jgi:hypothetical protein